MASKVWKKLLFIILIIACLFNITLKLIQRNSFKQELQSSAQYIQNLVQEESTQDENVTNNNSTAQNTINIMNVQN